MSQLDSGEVIKSHFNEIRKLFLKEVGDVLKSSEQVRKVSELFDNMIAPTICNLLVAEEEYKRMTSQLESKLLEMDKAIESINEGDDWRSSSNNLFGKS